NGANIRAGVSVDQVAAQRVGSATRFPSLEIGAEGGRQAGNCDSGYSCAYSSNLSWRSATTPNPKEVNPRAVFDRLFAGASRSASEQNRSRRELYNQSVLHFIADDAQTLMNRLGSQDQRRLDEYLSSIREIERRLNASAAPPPEAPRGASRPTGISRDYREHIRLLADMLVL